MRVHSTVWSSPSCPWFCRELEEYSPTLLQCEAAVRKNKSYINCEVMSGLVVAYFIDRRFAVEVDRVIGREGVFVVLRETDGSVLYSAREDEEVAKESDLFFFPDRNRNSLQEHIKD